MSYPLFIFHLFYQIREQWNQYNYCKKVNKFCSYGYWVSSAPLLLYKTFIFSIYVSFRDSIINAAITIITIHQCTHQLLVYFVLRKLSFWWIFPNILPIYVIWLKNDSAYVFVYCKRRQKCFIFSTHKHTYIECYLSNQLSNLRCSVFVNNSSLASTIHIHPVIFFFKCKCKQKLTESM